MPALHAFGKSFFAVIGPGISPNYWQFGEGAANHEK